MANEIRLEVVAFTLRKSGDRSTVYKPHNVLGSDFFTDFKKFLTSLDILTTDDVIKSAIRLKNKSLKFDSNQRTYRGVFESGHYGREGILENLKTKKRKKKLVDDVDILPFYFLVAMPNDSQIGIIMLQRMGVFGVSTVFKRALYAFVHNAFNKTVTVDFEAVVTDELAKEFKKGEIKELVLTKYSLPSDKADRLGLQAFQKNLLSIEIRIKAKRSGFFTQNAVNKFVNDRNARFFTATGAGNLGFDGSHQVEVVSQRSGVKRKVNLSNIGDIRPYYDIDADVKKSKNGQPDFGSIDGIALGLLKDVL